MCTNKCAQPDGHFQRLGGLLTRTKIQITMGYQVRGCTAEKFLQLSRALSYAANSRESAKCSFFRGALSQMGKLTWD